MAKLENWWVEGLSEIIFQILGASLEISGLWVDFEKVEGLIYKMVRISEIQELFLNGKIC
jgi:hypothetical protein